MAHEVKFPCPHCRRIVRLNDISRNQCLLMSEVARVLRTSTNCLRHMFEWPQRIGSTSASVKSNTTHRFDIYLRSEVLEAIRKAPKLGPAAAALVDQVLP